MKSKALITLYIIFLCVNLSDNAPRRKRGLGNIYTKTWTNATIPYFISPSFSDSDVFYLKRAMAVYSNETCIRFEPYKPDVHPNWLKIDDSEICHSDIGMQNTGQQALYMAKSCRNFGLMLHEIAHTLGLLHEMMRPDRNQFIQVFTDNIQDEAIQGFNIESQHYKLFGTPFDFQSVTMYSPYDFSKNSLPVWTKLNNSDTTPIFDSREKDISFWDIRALNEMYLCSNHCSPLSCSFPSFMTKNCTCQSPEDFADRRCVDDPSYITICRNASLDDVCYNKPIIASTLCRKTCGRCFRYGNHGVSSPPKYNCVDHNIERCKRNKIDGYCFTDTWTKVNCKLSCNKCTNHSDPSVIEFVCKDRHNSDLCEEWASNRQCEGNPGFMKSNCALSCGICVTNTTVSKPVAPCRNYSPDSYCDAMAREKKCDGTTLTICLGSCGKCGSNYERNEANITEKEIEKVHKITIKKECKDRLTDCEYFARAGHCETSKDSMKYHCNKSCNFCNDDDCSNVDSDHVCDDVKQRGLCKLHAGFASRCKKTCQQCTVIASTVVIARLCVDKDSKFICEELVRRKQCRVDLNRTRSCLLSCRLCNTSFAEITQMANKPSLVTTPSTSCTDEDNDETCERLRSNGWCQSYLNRAVRCRKSCNLCEISVTTTKCQNQDNTLSCQSWASGGYCTDHREYMMTRCALTCRFCSTQNDLTSPQPSTPMVCRNVETDDTCETWKYRGFCVDYFNYMRRHCALTCNLCGFSATTRTVVRKTTTPPCVNNQPDDTCDSWKQGNYCTLDYIAEMCKKSCLRCTQ